MLKPRVEVRNEGGVLVAEFWDCLRLDPAPVVELRNKYEVHLRAQGLPQLVIDFNGVSYAGSAALGHFVALNRLARQQGGRLIFCNVDLTVLEAFRISKLEPLFTFVPDKPAALRLATGALPDPTDATPAPDAAPSPPRTPGQNKSGGNGLLRGSRRRKLS